MIGLSINQQNHYRNSDCSFVNAKSNIFYPERADLFLGDSYDTRPGVFFRSLDRRTSHFFRPSIDFQCLSPSCTLRNKTFKTKRICKNREVVFLPGYSAKSSLNVGRCSSAHPVQQFHLSSITSTNRTKKAEKFAENDKIKLRIINKLL